MKKQLVTYQTVYTGLDKLMLKMEQSLHSSWCEILHGFVGTTRDSVNYPGGVLLDVFPEDIKDFFVGQEK